MRKNSSEPAALERWLLRHPDSGKQGRPDSLANSRYFDIHGVYHRSCINVEGHLQEFGLGNTSANLLQ